MQLSNDQYLITLKAGSGLEYYYRDGPGWVKQSVRGRQFKATAEQVLNHLLPALAGLKDGVSAEVRHAESDTAAATQLATLRGLRR